MVPTSTLKRRERRGGASGPTVGGGDVCAPADSNGGFPATSGDPDEFMFIQLPVDHSNASAAGRPRIGTRLARRSDRWVSGIQAGAPGATGFCATSAFLCVIARSFWSRELSARVVKDEAHRVPPPRAQAAHAVSHRHAVGAARARHRALVDREDHGLALRERYDFGARLHARALLGQHELAAGEVLARPAQQHRELQRKLQVAVQVLVQAVVVAFVVAQQQGGGAQLARRVAACEVGGVIGGIVGRLAHRARPGIGERREAFVECAAPRRDQRRQRIREVLVFALAEAVALHDHAAAEMMAAFVVHRRELGAFLRREELAGGGAAAGGEIGLDARPVECVDAGRMGCRHARSVPPRRKHGSPFSAPFFRAYYRTWLRCVGV